MGHSIKKGDKFCSLVVESAKPEKRGRALYWLCRCRCGSTILAQPSMLVRGITSSCSKCGYARAGAAKALHGESRRSVEYGTWMRIWSRVRGTATGSASYVAKGITVCRRWQKFSNFLRDMGRRPKGCSIDRIDNSKGYSPGNCRWATREQQANNTSRNVYVEADGQPMTLSQLARRYGLSVQTVIGRYRRGDRMPDICRAVS